MYLRHPEDGSNLLKHVGVNLESSNKSYYYHLDAFVGYLITILQSARSNCPVVLLVFISALSKLHCMKNKKWKEERRKCH
jgi:hypothetical protein